MSISKAQAAALADGILDEVAEGKFVPKETITELIILAYELIELAQENLNETKTNASGNLSKSLEATEPISANGFIQIDIEMLFYGQFVNKGVKGTKSGQGEYKFKHDMPSESMVKAIKQYIKDARSKIGNVKKPVGYESKNKSIAEASRAFAMARSILQHGIKPNFFMDKAIDETDKKISDRFGDALAIDVLNSLPDNLN